MSPCLWGRADLPLTWKLMRLLSHRLLPSKFRRYALLFTPPNRDLQRSILTGLISLGLPSFSCSQKYSVLFLPCSPAFGGIQKGSARPVGTPAGKSLRGFSLPWRRKRPPPSLLPLPPLRPFPVAWLYSVTEDDCPPPPFFVSALGLGTDLYVSDIFQQAWALGPHACAYFNSSQLPLPYLRRTAELQVHSNTRVHGSDFGGYGAK